MPDPQPTLSVDADGRIDPYRLAHKGLRMLLGRLLEVAGRTDFADASALERLREQSMDAVDVLRTHTRIEVLFIDTYLVGPCGDTDLQREHTELEAQMFGLVRTLGDLASIGVAAEARARGHAFYLALSRFVARYLVHMAEEETNALALLHRNVEDATLREVLVAARSAIHEKDRGKSRSAILDAIAPHERELLGIAPPARKKPAA